MASLAAPGCTPRLGAYTSHNNSMQQHTQVSLTLSFEMTTTLQVVISKDDVKLTNLILHS